MTEIQLTQHKKTQIDDQDCKIVNQYKWCTQKAAGGRYYAVSNIADPQSGKMKRLYLHRLLLNPANGLVIEHKDSNTLNNQRNNLQITPSVASQDKAVDVVHKSRYRGVYYVPKGIKTWRACITHNGKFKHIGSFESELDAAMARDNAAVEAWSEFAKLNFPK